MRPLRCALLGVGLALLAHPATGAETIDDHIIAQGPQVDDYLQQQMKSQHIPGLSCAVVHDGKLLLARSYGLANVELQAPTSPSSVYQLASITKQFTAVGIMMLVEEGKVKLDEKITVYLPNLPATWSEVTVRHLLTHTSGITDYTDVPKFWQTSRQDVDKSYLISLLTPIPLQFAPGSRWAYSNTGYLLLGTILEQVSGQKSPAFLRQRIFEPLQMTATQANDLAAIVPQRTKGYTLKGTRILNAQNWSPVPLRGADDLISTVEDMAKWDAALSTEQILKRSSLEQMWTPATLTNGKKAAFFGSSSGYGFGWAIQNYGKPTALIYHPGYMPGFSTWVLRYLGDNVTTIVFTNTDSADPGKMADQLHRIVTRNLPAPTP